MAKGGGGCLGGVCGKGLGRLGGVCRRECLRSVLGRCV